MGDDPEALLRVAVEHHQAGRLAEAEALYRRVLETHPGNGQVLNLLGLVAHQSGRHKEAVAVITEAIAKMPPNTHFLLNLGVAQKALGHTPEAIASYRRALEIDPAYAAAHHNLGNALFDTGDLDEAAGHYRRAIEAKPDYAESHNNLGNVLREQGSADGAVASYRRAVEANPLFAEAYNNLGNMLMDGDEAESAVACFQKALEIAPEFPAAHNNLGITLAGQGKLTEAMASLERALELDPDLGEAAAGLLLLYQRTCSWKAIADLGPKVDAATATAIAADRQPGETPFLNMTRCADPAVNFDVARLWSRGMVRRAAALGVQFEPRAERTRGKKITLGYLSSDYRNHPIGHLIAGLFAVHDRDRFEAFAYSSGEDDASAYRRKVEEGSDRFTDISTLGDAEAARRIYEDGVDILIDVNGHTEGHRLGVAALRPASVQATYLGFPGTSGADFIDYVITDGTVSPPDHAAFYSEAFVRLPHCYQVNDCSTPIAKQKVARSSLDLPEDGLVFCSLNQTLKFEPVIFDVWMRLLEGVAGSVLWLLEANALAEDNLNREAAARGIDPARVVFAGRLPKDEHLARLECADLALDTRIYNGHTSTSDALWAGLPVLTLKGRHFASRVSASILAAAGIPELITESLEDYEALALRLAGASEELAALRDRVRECRRAEPLFDTPGFASNLEQAYGRMWELHEAGEAPRPIEVEDGA